MQNTKKTLSSREKLHTGILRLTVTAMFMALNIVLSSFGVPVLGGKIYLNEIAICTAAILLDPVSAFLVGGVGAFLGDLFFYPAPMYVSLVTHGVQAIVISVFSHYILRRKPVISSAIGVALGAVIMVAGYTFGKIFIYSTLEYALMKLPFQILQAVVGAVLAMLIVWRFGVVKLFRKKGLYPELPTEENEKSENAAQPV